MYNNKQTRHGFPPPPPDRTVVLFLGEAAARMESPDSTPLAPRKREKGNGKGNWGRPGGAILARGNDELQTGCATDLISSLGAPPVPSFHTF